MATDWYPGIREFCEHWYHAPMLQQTFQALEEEFENGRDGCIDASKAIVECACQLLVAELDDPLNPITGWPDSPLKVKPEKLGVTHWTSAALMLLKLRPSSKSDDNFRRVAAQINTLASELNLFRNEAGNISHGRIGFANKLSANHRRAAVMSADNIINFLHTAYLERDPDPVRTFEPYNRFEKSNELIDEHCILSVSEGEDGSLTASVEIPSDDLEPEEIFLNMSPSALLFGVDRESYKVALNACRNIQKNGGGENEDGE